MAENTTIEGEEMEFAQALRQRRQAPGPPAAKISGERIEKLERLAANKDKIVTFVFSSVIAGGNAFLNYIGIGSVPVVGDVIDLSAGVTISALLFTLEGHPRWKAQGAMWLFTFVEFIPGADLFSPQLIGTVLALGIALHAANKAQEQLEQMRGGGVPDEFESQE